MKRRLATVTIAAILLSGCSHVVCRYAAVTTKNLSFENRESELVTRGVTGKSDWWFCYAVVFIGGGGRDRWTSADDAIDSALQSAGGDYMTNVVVKHSRLWIIPFYVREGFYATGDVYRFKPPVAEQGLARSPGLVGSAASGYDEVLRLYGAGDYAAAMSRVDGLLQAEPGNWQAWQLKGNCHYAQGDLQNAMASYRRSLELNPNNADLRKFVEGLSPK